MSSIPKGITRDDVLEAIGDFQEGAEHAFGPSTHCDLVYEDEPYPPKAVLGLAARRLLGRPLLPSEFTSGDSSKCFKILRNLGFEIVRKADSAAEARRNDYGPVWRRLLESAALSAAPRLYWRSEADLYCLPNLEVCAQEQVPMAAVPKEVFKLCNEKLNTEYLDQLQSNMAAKNPDEALLQRMRNRVMNALQGLRESPEEEHTLGDICSGMFGPCTAPESKSHGYNPYTQLRFENTEIAPAFPELSETSGRSTPADLRRLLTTAELVDDASEEEDEQTPRATWIEIVSGDHQHGGKGWELGTCLWSPTKDKAGRERYAVMREPQEGDLVLHFVKDEWPDGPTETRIAGLSHVQRSFREVTEVRLRSLRWPVPGIPGVARSMLRSQGAGSPSP